MEFCSVLCLPSSLTKQTMVSLNPQLGAIWSEATINNMRNSFRPSNSGRICICRNWQSCHACCSRTRVCTCMCTYLYLYLHSYLNLYLSSEPVHTFRLPWQTCHACNRRNRARSPPDFLLLLTGPLQSAGKWKWLLERGKWKCYILSSSFVRLFEWGFRIKVFSGPQRAIPRLCFLDALASLDFTLVSK